MTDAPERIWATGIGYKRGQESGTFVEKGDEYPNPPNVDAIEYTRSDLTADAIRQARNEALREGYLAGFKSSAEGWNGEWPFEGQEPEDDQDWVNMRDEELSAMIDKEGEEGKEDNWKSISDIASEMVKGQIS